MDATFASLSPQLWGPMVSFCPPEQPGRFLFRQGKMSSCGARSWQHPAGSPVPVALGGTGGLAGAPHATSSLPPLGPGCCVRPSVHPGRHGASLRAGRVCRLPACPGTGLAQRGGRVLRQAPRVRGGCAGGEGRGWMAAGDGDLGGMWTAFILLPLELSSPPPPTSVLQITLIPVHIYGQRCFLCEVAASRRGGEEEPG